MKHLPLASAVLVVLAMLLPLAAAAQGNDLYLTGTRALNEQRWADAVTAFTRVSDSRGKKADAALYWKAYSLSKLGKPTLVSATCAQLRSAYRGSSWNKDCSALTVDLGQNDVPHPADLQGLSDLGNLGDLALNAGGNATLTDDQTSLKLLALNSLMNRDPAQALPILRNLLNGNQPDSVKEHALFVLAQNSSPEARQLMHELVLGHANPALQRQAIQMLGITEGKRANDTLEQLYRSTSDAQIKRTVISTFFITGDAPRMVRLAREEKNLDQKRTIVSQLALMQDKAATDYMLELLK